MLAVVGPMRVITLAVAIIVIIVVLVLVRMVLAFFKLWLQAKLTHADVTFIELIGMWLRKTDYKTIVLSKIMAVHAGLMLSTRELESHYLAGGHVDRVVNALIAAKRNNVDLNFTDAAMIDLEGRDVLAEVLACTSEGTAEGPLAVAEIETEDVSLEDSDIPELRAGPDT